MLPIVRKDHNLLYFGPTADIGDLPCRREAPGKISGHWRPTAEELEVLNAGGSVEVSVWTEPIPPIAVNVVTSADDAQVVVDANCPRCGSSEVVEAPLRQLLCTECHKAFPRPREESKT